VPPPAPAEGFTTPAAASPAPAAAANSAVTLPVARVALDVPLAHLDRPFDYLVPERFAEVAVAGCRVRVRFAGRQVSGFVLERLAASAHEGRLAALTRVVSPEPVLTPEIARLARTVADRYAGTLADVLRLAVPPRHARVEAEVPGAPPADKPPPRPTRPAPGWWDRYVAGPEFLTALAEPQAESQSEAQPERQSGPRAVWTALPGPSWPSELALAAQAALAGGRGALLVLPDARDVAWVDAALLDALGPGQHVALTADLGPAERYRRWLRVLRGTARAVVGTRAAMFAPVADLGLAVVWDDGDDLHAEPHAPYPHVREVLALRAYAAGAGLLLGGFARTAEGAQLIATGWARSLAARRGVVRELAPRVRPADDDADLARDAAAHVARLPTLAWQTARVALRTGPVLVQVPRAGYLPSVACVRCRAAARCLHCTGPLAVTSGHAVAHCRWCGRPAGGWRCAECGATGMRARVVGARRTAEELGRAFSSVPVRTSGGSSVLASVGAEPAVVVATPGAEPVAAEGYAAALLLDGWALLDRPDLRAGEEALRRWTNAAALVRPAAAGGEVVVLAAGDLRPAQALLRWDPAWYAERELADRSELGFPPAARWATVTGAAAGVEDFLAVFRSVLRSVLQSVRLPTQAQVLGPVPTPPAAGAPRPGEGAAAPPADVRALIRVPLAEAAALSTALRTAQGLRTARKAADPVRIRIDPMELG